MYVAFLGWVVVAGVLVAGWRLINKHVWWRVAALGVVLGFSLVHQRLFGTVAEDAFISFRYSVNLAEGNGLVFNAGERVEGYSNFLWVVLVAVPHWLFGTGTVVGAVVLGVLCTLGCVVLAYFLTNRIVRPVRAAAGREPAPALGVAAALLTGAASGLAAYGPSGLETPLFLLLVLGCCYALTARRHLVAGVLVALATMTRPDGLVVVAIAGIWLLSRVRQGGPGWRGVGGFVFGALLLAVPWTVWRLAYYGYLMPNALAAKAGGSLAWQLEEGWAYVAGFGLAHQGFALLAAAGLAAICYPRPGGSPESAHARSVVWLLFILALGYLVFILFTGGDWMPAWRMLAPVPPLLAVASVAAYGVVTSAPAADRLRLPARRMTAAVAVGLSGLSLFVSVMSPAMADEMHDWRTKIAGMQEIGSWLGERLPPGSVLSTYANGALSYRAGTRVSVVDVLGLTDEHIARKGKRDETAGPVGHIVTDFDYVVNERRPTVAVTTGSGYLPSQECAVPNVYADDYGVATFRRNGTSGWVPVYPRQDQYAAVVAALDADPRFTFVPCPPAGSGGHDQGLARK
ncbi:hypothetical protein [Amycolatopsis anabasis]|uniref:hypothetical protein n=1 Tax=Amycolatopsis anabasis TaxID=1840409 RepID=UPI00131DFE7A|nr:hypothetical protein [Amycolatopsis anabasis]